MSASVTEAVVESLVCSGNPRVVARTADELKASQYGFQLNHYAQHYFFGATGLRIGAFYSIAGAPASCKSPLLFDLMASICADKEHNGIAGTGCIYELEEKISPTLFSSVIGHYGEYAKNHVISFSGVSLDAALEHLNREIFPRYRKVAPKNNVALLVGFDSIGGAATEALSKKIAEEGAVGKGFHEKAHIVKNFCENFKETRGNIPVVVLTVNQEKEKISQTPGYSGPPQKQITGGVSQIFKDGFMLSSTAKSLASGDGKLLTLRTTKTSFSDSRKIELKFCWNKFGNLENRDDIYGHHFEWALASAKCLADPEKGVGDLRDIADVKVSDLNLVTCPQLGCKSVKPEEFEAALFANKQVLSDLYCYQKIDVLKTLDDYVADLETMKEAGKKKPEVVAVADKPEKPKAKPKAKAAVAPGAFRRAMTESKTDAPNENLMDIVGEASSND